MNKKEASNRTQALNSMDNTEFNKMRNGWAQILLNENKDDYRKIREEGYAAFCKVQNIILGNSEYKKKEDYYIDLFFGLEMYFILKKFGMGLRIASEDKVWIYLCTNVFPDIIYKRYGKDNKISEDRVWKSSRRIYLKVLWWYIHLSLQKGDSEEALEATKSILINNSTDEIVQLVERSGRFGYRVDLYREIMKVYSTINVKGSKRNIFRKVMVLNTARTAVVEPSLTRDGVPGYVKGLFSHFGY